MGARYTRPANRVPTFEESYHGLAMREGVEAVANCASCHGVHNIFPPSDPRSTVSPANLAETCGKCHAGAGKRFAIGPVHISPASPTDNPVVRVEPGRLITADGTALSLSAAVAGLRLSSAAAQTWRHERERSARAGF